MTSFNTLFNRMFQEKSKAVYLIYLIQTFASLCFTLMMFFSTRGQDPQIVVGKARETVNPIIEFLFMFAAMVAVTSVFAGFVYWIISSVKNERINRSQTWRLIPISDTKFLLSNFGTALISYIWLQIIEIVTVVVASLPLLFASKEIKGLFQGSNHNISAQDWWQLLGGIVFVILLGYAWYAVVSLINLSSKSIMDFLPGGSSKALMFLVRLVVIVMVVWLLGYAGSVLFSVVGRFTPFALGNGDIQMGSTILGFLAFDVVITLIDILLLNKFVEAKQN
ncbi:ABC transporter permease [uncultured Lactobacillus sp.]|uniref:ABC transporter permease n=1 Tax=uncultured Lactobacillus sp. TaxID=153152 RepID=UPI002803C97E|nr:ABC transporter permease [uncultured Lactobacillus sp.]